MLAICTYTTLYSISVFPIIKKLLEIIIEIKTVFIWNYSFLENSSIYVLNLDQKFCNEIFEIKLVILLKKLVILLKKYDNN